MDRNILRNIQFSFWENQLSCRAYEDRCTKMDLNWIWQKFNLVFLGDLSSKIWSQKKKQRAILLTMCRADKYYKFPSIDIPDKSHERSSSARGENVWFEKKKVASGEEWIFSCILERWNSKTCQDFWKGKRNGRGEKTFKPDYWRAGISTISFSLCLLFALALGIRTLNPRIWHEWQISSGANHVLSQLGNLFFVEIIHQKK